jgi:putative oxidoreductase
MANIIVRAVENILSLLKSIPEEFITLSSRLAMASVFWRSAQTKIDGWNFLDQSWQFFNLNSSTFLLFRHEYNVPLVDHEIAAYMATFGEFFFSLALLLGFMTRFSAFGLLGMTAVIQIFVYPDAWPTHIMWLAILLYIIKHGPGKLSLDNVLFNR